MDCIALQTPLSMGFLRQEHWSGLPFSSLIRALMPFIRVRSHDLINFQRPHLYLLVQPAQFPFPRAKSKALLTSSKMSQHPTLTDLGLGAMGAYRQSIPERPELSFNPRKVGA